MARPRVAAAGGMAAILYTLGKGREAGGVLKLYGRLRTRNTCKTCAVGMGGQRGGMLNEAGHSPEACKKSVQAQAADMAGVIEHGFFARTSIEEMKAMTALELEKLGRLGFPILAEPGDRHFRRHQQKDKLGLFRHWPSSGTYLVLSQLPLLPQVTAMIRPYRRWAV